MRQIKFRAWDKKLSVMWEAIEFTVLLRYLMFQQMPNATAYKEIKDHFSEIDWMQFTGLKDNNGREIYAGDIVRWTRKNWISSDHPESGNDLVDICAVYWCEQHHGFENNCRKENTTPIYSSGRLGFADDRAKENIIEVIGNAYENPELLEGKT